MGSLAKRVHPSSQIFRNLKGGRAKPDKRSILLPAEEPAASF